MALDHACGNGRHTLAERGLDLYETPAVAVEALLKVEQIPHGVWECAAGRGAIAKVLQASTSEVYGDPDVHPQPESYRGNVNPIGPRACYDEGKRAANTRFEAENIR